MVKTWLSRSLHTVGSGKSIAYPKTSAGVTNHLKNGIKSRVVLITVEVTEVFANGTGAQPTFKIGEEASDAKFAATTEFTNATLGTKKQYHGLLSATKKLIVTATAGTGTATGALLITVVSAPEE